MNIVSRVTLLAKVGTVIPKPRAGRGFKIKGQGRRRGKSALVYFVPNRKHPKEPYEKGVTFDEISSAYHQLKKTGQFSHRWFQKNLAGCASEGSCNFTTLGGLLILAGVARYSGPGVYVP